MLFLMRSRALSAPLLPIELNDINEMNYNPTFVDDDKNRESINREYASALTELFPTSPISVEDVERYRHETSSRIWG